MTADDQIAKLNTGAPHAARVWNYFLGGKDNFAADREMGRRMLEAFPGLADVARASRAFLERAVTFLAGDAGIRQFLDIGTGLPVANNTHEVAQRVAPTSRVVYVDNDPLVLAHARALLTSGPEGVTAYIDADVRAPGTILKKAADTLDFGQPIGLMMLGILGHVVDYDQALAIVSELKDALPSGSYLVINDGTNEVTPEERNRGREISEEEGVPYIPRTRQQIAAYFDGFELVEPGVVSTPLWRPSDGQEITQELDVACGVGRKP
jgi:hypothetical protein